MDSNKNLVTAKRYLYLMNSFVLMVHTTLFVVFSLLGISIMQYVNICSILCYCLCYLLIRKELIKEFILTAFFEIMIHSLLATLCLGCDSDFQLYFIGSVAIVLFSQYFNVHIGAKSINGIALSFICAILFIAILFIDRMYEPYYYLPENVTFAFVVFNSVLAFGFLILFFGMLTKIATANELELAKQATHDNLTGLMNRHYLTRYMNELQKSGSLENYWLAILDIDDFKEVNDTYGHLCGDYVLKSVADMIQKRSGDRIVCRWGGEEFMIVGVSTNSNEIDLLEDIRRNIADEPFVYEGTKLNLTVTIGAARYQSGQPQPLDTWVQLADSRLYEGKQTGKNKVVGV